MPQSMSPLLIASFVVAIVIDIGLPIAIAIWVKRRFGIGWKVFLQGALVFFLSQMVIRIPAMKVAEYFMVDQLQSSAGFLLFWMVLAALTAGLFEEVGRFVGIKLMWKKVEKTFGRGMMYGAGHGGIESILLIGGLAVASLVGGILLVGSDVNELGIEGEALAQAVEARNTYLDMSWWLPLMGGVERVFAMLIQMSLSVMVVQCFIRKQLRWLWIAIGYHFAVDLVAVLMTHYVADSFGQSTSMLLTTGVVAVFAVISIFIIGRLWRIPQNPSCIDSPRLL